MSEDPRGIPVEAAMTQLREMKERGWRLTIHFDGDRVDDISASAGDCNCPHQKQYDPKDGHGWSQWGPTDDWNKEASDFGPVGKAWCVLMDNDGVPLADAINFAYSHIMTIVPGAPY